MNSTRTRPHTVVTGASSGIGRATALRLAAAGRHVFAGVRKPADASESGPGARGLYADSFSRMVRVGLARERRGSPPDVVAQAVAHALAARRPHARYLVGKDSRPMAVMAAALPAPVLDGLRRRITRQPARGALAGRAAS